MRSTILPCLLLTACASGPAAAPPSGAPGGPITAAAARHKLESISKNKRQLWVVVHIRANKTTKADGSVDEEKLFADALANADAVVEGGGDMIVLINSRTEMPLYERVIAAVRQKYPEFPIGISALSYGISNLTEGFRLAKKFSAQMVWCETVPDEKMEYEDDDGSYKPAEVIPLALALQTQKNERPEAIHAAGVHMKYTRPLDGKTFEEAMAAALGKVDAINVTGPKTGVRADVERIQSARKVAGDYPMGLASGVSTENVGEIIDLIDYAIVGTSLKMDQDPLRTDVNKVKALRAKMTELSAGPRTP
ncbi:MAG: BtpA/SgcQ family protein [Myxococcota bacterium]